MKFYTVKTLKNKLEELCAKGMGNRLVMLPNPDYDKWDDDFITVGEVQTGDLSGRCVYLDPLSPEDELILWMKIEKNL